MTPRTREALEALRHEVSASYCQPHEVRMLLLLLVEILVAEAKADHPVASDQGAT